jgi:hypothetical protein
MATAARSNGTRRRDHVDRGRVDAPEDYLDTLDAAFDTLDQQLSGRVAATKPRNPSGPLGQSSGAADPRSPGRLPQPGGSTPGNPVFEVDDEWFGGEESQSRADARAGRREIAEDLASPDLQMKKAEARPDPIFEVDDEWFADDDNTRAAKDDQQKVLAAEMGIHEVEMPAPAPMADGAVPGSDADFDFGLDDIKKLQEMPPPAPVDASVEFAAPPASEQAHSEFEAAAFAELLNAALDVPVIEASALEMAAIPAAELPTTDATAAEVPVDDVPIADVSVAEVSVAEELAAEIPAAEIAAPAAWAPFELPVAAEPIADVPVVNVAVEAPKAPQTAFADDFAQLLAFEQGEHHEPPKAPEAEVRIVMPEITSDMLDQIAARVADRLNASLFGEQLRDAMTATVRTTVREVVSETSERLVRDEIDRIKNKNQSR